MESVGSITHQGVLLLHLRFGAQDQLSRTLEYGHCRKHLAITLDLGIESSHGDSMRSYPSQLSRSGLHRGEAGREELSVQFHLSLILQKQKDEPNGTYCNLLSSLKYPLVSGLRSEWGSSCREVPLPDPSAALSYFFPFLFPSFPSSVLLLLLLNRDARNCCPIKMIIAAAEAGVAS